MRHLAGALLGAVEEGFSNGQSRVVTFELVNLIRTHGLCEQHDLQLRVYVHDFFSCMCIIKDPLEYFGCARPKSRPKFLLIC